MTGNGALIATMAVIWVGLSLYVLWLGSRDSGSNQARDRKENDDGITP